LHDILADNQYTTMMAQSTYSSFAGVAPPAIPFVPPPNLKGLLVGSGSDGLNEPTIARAILRLATEHWEEGEESKEDYDDYDEYDYINHNNNNNSTHSQGHHDYHHHHHDKTTVNVLYLGTATYDQPGPFERQTSQILKQCDKSNKHFGDITCHIEHLDLVDYAPPPAELQAAVDKADVIVASGGNTLFAVDRWRALGLDSLLETAMERGAVLTGGSAGAICWFQGGHSDSMDPDTYKAAVAGGNVQEGFDEEGKSAESDDEHDHDHDHDHEEEEAHNWEYIRIDGLGFLPALTCPHYDRIQSNGIVRGQDFEATLLKQSTELGIGIDHWAALEIAHGRYRVISIPGKKRLGGGGNENETDHNTRPGVWIKKVINGRVETRRCPPEGDLQELLSSWPTTILHDPRVDLCRRDNPDNGPRPRSFFSRPSTRRM
jgi:dipeptidase E